MNLTIDNLSATTGWSAAGGTTSIYGLNDHPEYIAGQNSNSIIFKFAGLSSYVEKTYGTDVSNYNEITLHLWSREEYSTDFKKIADFAYSIDLGTGKLYYLPTIPGFNSVTLDISSVSTIDRIRITALTGTTDYLVCSYVVASTDELPLDLFTGIKEGLETRRDASSTYLLGTIDATTGDTSINLNNFNFVDDYCVIKIDDGVNNEIHQLKRHNEGSFTFTDLYDGKTILNDYSSGSTYLYFPVEYGRDTTEIIIPGITIWGMEPSHDPNSFEVETIVDNWTATGASERREGHYLNFPITLNIESRHDELLAHLGTIVRTFLGRKKLYINGRTMRIEFNTTPVEIRPTEHIDIIPQLTYQGTVEIREDLWARQSLVITTTQNTEVSIQS
jgi:hypothetical protein